jgi:hypothetical protein
LKSTAEVLLPLDIGDLLEGVLAAGS